MKKNLITVITLALVVINLALTAVLALAVVPETQKANTLISKVADAIDLDQNAGTTKDASSYPIDQISVYNIADSMTINLKKGSDGVQHYAVLSVSLSANNKSDAYSKYYDSLKDKESLIKSTVNDVVSSYTLDQIQADQSSVEKEIQKKLATLFESDDFIVGVGFSSATYQ